MNSAWYKTGFPEPRPESKRTDDLLCHTLGRRVVVRRSAFPLWNRPEMALTKCKGRSNNRCWVWRKDGAEG
jgi:hypothetical protein